MIKEDQNEREAAIDWNPETLLNDSRLDSVQPDECVSLGPERS